MNSTSVQDVHGQTRPALARLRAAADKLVNPVRFMDICGTHAHGAFRSGLTTLLPPNVTLLSGMGGPACVTSQGDIDQFIDVCRRSGVTLCIHGDILRVTGSHGTLEQSRAEGADIRVVYSSQDALRLAAAEHHRQIVFAGVGFETGAACTAAAVLDADRLKLNNFSIIASHKLTMPAMRAILESGDVPIDGFLCPGHVSVIIGAAAFDPIVHEYHLPCVIAGYEAAQTAAGLARLTELVARGEPALENLYPQAVTEHGNQAAQVIMDKVFAAADWTWRGLGELKGSGLAVRPEYARYDARSRFSLKTPVAKEPMGNRCGDIITGRATPLECKMFGSACTPSHAIGPCMGNSQGACQSWFKFHRTRHLRKAQELA
jgi:hydrogenase expression/formation protein HypD